MVQFEEIDRIPEEIRERAGRGGREKAAETKAVEALQVGDVLRFAGEREEIKRLRKCFEAMRRRRRAEGIDYLICQQKGVLFVERVK